MTHELRIEPERESYAPGEDVVIFFSTEGNAEAVELSLAYRTEGAGDEDLGVAWLERCNGSKGNVEVALPRSPCSYDGTLIKIFWELRMRPIVGGALGTSTTVPLTIGSVQPGKPK